jgi:hypothetical protein
MPLWRLSRTSSRTALKSHLFMLMRRLGLVLEIGIAGPQFHVHPGAKILAAPKAPIRQELRRSGSFLVEHIFQ